MHRVTALLPDLLAAAPLRVWVLAAALALLACAAGIAGASWAWFSSSVETASQSVQAASFSLASVMVDNTPLTPADGTYTCSLTAGNAYSVSITGQGTAASGYALVEADGAKGCAASLANDTTVTFTLQPANNCTLTISARWGSVPEGATPLEDGKIYAVDGTAFTESSQQDAGDTTTQQNNELAAPSTDTTPATDDTTTIGPEPGTPAENPDEQNPGTAGTGDTTTEGTTPSAGSGTTTQPTPDTTLTTPGGETTGGTAAEKPVEPAAESGTTPPTDPAPSEGTSAAGTAPAAAADTNSTTPAETTPAAASVTPAEPATQN